MFKMPNTPIELSDDGLRLRKSEIIYISRHDGKPQTNPDGFRLVAYENPEHMAYAVSVKRERQLIREQNIRKHS